MTLGNGSYFQFIPLFRWHHLKGLSHNRDRLQDRPPQDESWCRSRISGQVAVAHEGEEVTIEEIRGTNECL